MTITVPIWAVWIAKAVGVCLGIVGAFYVLSAAVIGFAVAWSFSRK